MRNDAPELKNSWITLVPYLPLGAAAEFAGWWLGPLAEAPGPWKSPELRHRVEALAGAFFDASGQPLSRVAVLHRTATGVDGHRPSDAEIRALELTIAFGTIHQNPFWTADNRDDSWRVATADNAALWVQPIDLHHGRIALGRGGRVTILSGGHRLDDERFAIQPPLELHIPTKVSLDPHLLEALYTSLLDPPAGHGHDIEALRVAIRWLVKSWQNSPSITWEDRLVYLKVATEALSGEDKSHLAAASLVELFRSAHVQPGAPIGTEELLWQPDEPSLTRTWTDRGKPKSAEVTQFEHWACALADERNAIVHGEASHQPIYDVSASPYSGPFVEIADRVVREAIVVQLGNFGFPLAWRSGWARTSLAAHQRLSENTNKPGGGSPTT